MRFVPSLGRLLRRVTRRPEGRNAARRHRGRTRGQGLVEFALIAPVLLLILLMAIDFGRALYGWVVLQNSARIAANFAGINPEGWRDDIASVKAEYQAEIRADLDSANCDPPATLPDPVFTDGPDTAVTGGPPDSSYDVGDTVVVLLSCDFNVLTPIISAFLGNPVGLGASSEFRIRSGDLVGLAAPTKIPKPPAPPTPTPEPTPTAGVTPAPTTAPCLVSVSISRTPNGNIASGTSATFTAAANATGCSIVSYQWTFPQGTPASANTAGPHAVIFSTPNNVNVDVVVTVTTNTGATASDTEQVNLRK
jgi:hypothetical protein